MTRTLTVTDYDLLQIVTDFRRGILGRRSPVAWCFAICAPLEGLLSTYGVTANLVEGYYEGYPHDWLSLSDGRIIDPTASQFNDLRKHKMPKVYIGSRPEWYKEKAER